MFEEAKILKPKLNSADPSPTASIEE